MSVPLDGSLGELVEVVSASNEPTGVLVPRSRAHAEGLLHRTVYVLLSNAAGELLLQRRHERKAVCPGKWDVSCAEHCAPGESYLQAAERGCLEELGVTQPPALREALPATRRELTYTTRGGQRISDCEFVPLFTGCYGGPLLPDGVEVSDTRWVSKAALVVELEAQPQSFTPWSLETFRLLGVSPSRAGQ